MEEEVYTEMSEESWLGRIGSSITGILFGILLIMGAAGLLFWNEGRTVKTHKSLAQGAGLVKSIANSKVDELNEGQLVHLSGRASTTQVLSDNQFPVSLTALALKRRVQIYQWQETKQSEKKKKTGGGEETRTRYTYEKIWSESLIDSSGFKKAASHRNPGTKPVESRMITAETVNLGAFLLPDNLVRRIDAYEPVPPVPLSGTQRQIQWSDTGYYMGNNESAPEIGDARIVFSAVMPTDVTLVARQSGDSFAPYTTSAGGQIQELAVGHFSAAHMFENAQSANTLLSWGLRFLAVFLMMIGFFLVFTPFAVAADLVPFIGRIVAFGTGIIALLFTLTVSATVVAVAWIFYRPVIAALVLTAAVLIVFLTIRGKKG